MADYFRVRDVMEAVKTGIENGTDNVCGCAKEQQNNRIRLAIYDELLKLEYIELEEKK